MRKSLSEFGAIRRWLWAAVLCILLVAGMVGAPAVAAQAGDSTQLTVVYAAVNVRSGPDVTFPVVGGLMQGDMVPIVGQDAGSGWWQVQLPDGRSGWVTNGSAYVSVSGDTTAFAAGVAIAEPATPAASLPVAGSGGTIVFQAVSGGPIYAVNADGSGLRHLTTGMDPALSPDGQWVAFTRWDDIQPGALGSLWVIRVDGSDEHAVLGEIHQPKSPTWSPDGTHIVVNMQHGGRVDPERKCTAERPPREATDVEMRREIEDDGDIQILFCYTMPIHPRWGLREVDVATGTFRDLSDDLYSYSPSWDPANDWHVVYNGERGLMSLDLNQGTNVAITPDVNDHTPAVSPDGTRIAVSYWQNDHWEVHVLNADGTGRVRLTKMSAQEEIDQMMAGQLPKASNNAAPAWSPDGQRIVFLTDRTGQWEVWVMNADGSDQHALLPGDDQSGLGLQYNGMDERMLSWQ